MEGYCQISGEYCNSLDEHHIIPREFGGIDGPTIFLSPTIHQTIHRIYRDDSKVANFISRYPNSAYKIKQLVNMLKYANENLTKVESFDIRFSLNRFSEKEQEILIENADKYEIPVSEIIIQIVKKFLTNF